MYDTSGLKAIFDFINGFNFAGVFFFFWNLFLHPQNPPKIGNKN